MPRDAGFSGNQGGTATLTRPCFRGGFFYYANFFIRTARPRKQTVRAGSINFLEEIQKMEKLGLNEIRKMFLEFFESKGHIVHESFSLVPEKDKSLLLINSGMAPLKPYFCRP